jgi:hypothetical protein
LAYAEVVAVRICHAEVSEAPGLIGEWRQDLGPSCDTAGVDGLDVGNVR